MEKRIERNVCPPPQEISRSPHDLIDASGGRLIDLRRHLSTGVTAYLLQTDANAYFSTMFSVQTAC